MERILEDCGMGPGHQLRRSLRALLCSVDPESAEYERSPATNDGRRRQLPFRVAVAGDLRAGASAQQQVLVLVAGSALPLAVLAVRFPVVGGMAQFSAAYIGNQLLHEAPLRVLREFSCVSMGIALAILFLAVFRGILEITQEAFGEAEDTDEPRVMRAA